MSLYIFVHIPKTAGTTFHQSYLPAAFSESERFVVNGTGPKNRADREYLIGLPDIDKQRLKVIAGHNTFGLAEHFPGAKYLTVLRDPVQQALSRYLHERDHNREEPIGRYMAARGTTLEEFVEQDLLARFYPGMASVATTHNPQCEALRGQREPGELRGPDDYRALLDRIEAVGCTEEFELFLFGLHVRQGFPLVLFNNRLVQKNRADYPLSPHEVELIRRYNRHDVMLHALARQRFHEQVRARLEPDQLALFEEYRTALAQFRALTKSDIFAGRVIESPCKGSVRAVLEEVRLENSALTRRSEPMATLDSLLDCLTADHRPREDRPPIRTEVPGREAIELPAYYDEFRDYYPRCELLTKRWFVEHVRPDWVLLDCGANIGYYSILFSQLAPEGKVFAFEPTRTYQMLLANLRHAGAGNVETLRLAVGRGTGTFNEPVFRIWGQSPEIQNYPFTTIDDFVLGRKLQRVDALKIDVDSFDFEVLQGSEQVLRRFDPFIVVELNASLSRRGQSVAQALEWMCGQGYRDCLCLENDNFVFRRAGGWLAADSPLPEMKVRFDSSPPP